MSSTEDFKPGDVVVHPEYGRGILQEGETGWVTFAALRCAALPDIAADLRRLVVIDDEDHEQVEQLLGVMAGRGWTSLIDRWDELHPNTRRYITDATKTALRKFAKPKPSKPEEPLAIGAIVEDSSGDRWARLTHHGGSAWRRAVHGEHFYCNYANIDAVRVLSEGVQP